MRYGPELVELSPATCSEGHRLAFPNVLVGWAHCHCEGTTQGNGGHRTHECLLCLEVIYRGWHVCEADEEYRFINGSTHVRKRL